MYVYICLKSINLFFTYLILNLLEELSVFGVQVVREVIEVRKIPIILYPAPWRHPVRQREFLDMHVYIEYFNTAKPYRQWIFTDKSLICHLWSWLLTARLNLVMRDQHLTEYLNICLWCVYFSEKKGTDAYYCQYSWQDYSQARRLVWSIWTNVIFSRTLCVRFGKFEWMIFF